MAEAVATGEIEPAMTRARSGLLDEAARIGRTICASAYWHADRCNWVGRSPREMIEPGMPFIPTVTALGPELYGGTAGIALFLAQLHAQTRAERVRRTARGAMRQALWRSENLPSAVNTSFYSGLVGIAYAAVRVGLLLEEPQLVKDGIRLASRAAPSSDPDRLLDVIGGNAGAIAPLLWLARFPGGEALHQLASELAADLAAAATKRDGTWRWDPERASGKGIGSTPLCGFAHGASGLGLALLEIGVHDQREEWVDGGLAAFTYEDRLYDGDRENWPDLREFGPRPNDADTPPRSFMVAWCHGAAGIGLARLRAYQLLTERRADLLPGVERAIRATSTYLQVLPPDSDASPCHGRAGLIEVLLYAASVLGDRAYSDQAVETWIRTLRSRRAGAEWPCGVASGRNNPSLMLGVAGIGYGLLRAENPQSVPSVLVIGSPADPL
jgi:lantibiotic modifying enzyme